MNHAIKSYKDPAFDSLDHALERYRVQADTITYRPAHHTIPSDSTNTSAILFFMAERFKAGERFSPEADLPKRVATLQSLIADGTEPPAALRSVHAPHAARYYEMYHPEECGKPYSALREF